MAKPPKAVLAPRSAPDPSAVEAFISGRPVPSPEARSAPAAAGPLPPEGGRKVIERKDGRQLRRTTVYLEVNLARRVSIYAASHDLDQTEIIKAALEEWLDRNGG